MWGSKNDSVPRLGVEPVELEIGGQATAILPDAGQPLTSLRFLANRERPCAGHFDFDVVAFPQAQRRHPPRRQANRQAVTPFRNVPVASTV